jgi:hypothetical protein
MKECVLVPNRLEPLEETDRMLVEVEKIHTIQVEAYRKDKGHKPGFYN